MLGNDLIIKINTIYNLGEEVKFFGVVEGGFLSENYVLKNKKEKFFLKKYRPSLDLNRIREVHKVKKFFYQNKIPVIFPYKTRSGRTFFVWERNYYAIFPFVEGRQINMIKARKLEIKSLAELMAQIHILTKSKFAQLINPRIFDWDKNEFLREAEKILKIIESKNNKDKSDKVAIKLINQKIKLAEKNKAQYTDFCFERSHILHGDFHERNIFFNKDKKVIGIFDWEKANFGPRVFEIVRALEIIFFNYGYSKKIFYQVGIFLKKYNNLYPIRKEELRNGLLAWYLNQVHSLWVLNEIYIKYNDRVKPLLDKHRMFINYQSKNLDKFIDKVSISF